MIAALISSNHQTQYRVRLHRWGPISQPPICFQAQPLWSSKAAAKMAGGQDTAEANSSEIGQGVSRKSAEFKGKRTCLEVGALWAAFRLWRPARRWRCPTLVVRQCEPCWRTSMMPGQVSESGGLRVVFRGVSRGSAYGLKKIECFFWQAGCFLCIYSIKTDFK